jgi:hypothetical protein
VCDPVFKVKPGVAMPTRGHLRNEDPLLLSSDNVVVHRVRLSNRGSAAALKKA